MSKKTVIYFLLSVFIPPLAVIVFYYACYFLSISRV
jgi:hypothetical protein